MIAIGIDNETELLRRLSAGSEQAFTEIYECYSASVFNTIITYTQDMEAAKEILQQVFVKIWEGRAAMAQVVRLNDYLFISTRNAIFDYFKQIAREAALKYGLIKHWFPPAPHSPEHLAYEKDLFRLWSEAVDLLPPQQKQVYQWIEQQNWSLDQASGELKLSKATVKKHLELGRSSVRRYLKDTLLLLSSFLTTFY